jgi:hypothetical protein
VKLESYTGLYGYLFPSLQITGWNGLWTIRGLVGEFKPGPVLEAWRKAATGTVNAG